MFPLFFSCEIGVLMKDCEYRETKQKTLEEIAASFGDKVIVHEEGDMNKPSARGVEFVE